MIVTRNNHASLQKFIAQFNELFALKDIGPLHLFLGIEVTRDETGLYLTQTRYIEELIIKTDMTNTIPCPTPVVIGKPLLASDCEPMQNPTL